MNNANDAFPCLSREILSDLLDKSLSWKTRRQTEEHLARCSLCRANLASERRLHDAARLVSENAVAPERLHIWVETQTKTRSTPLTTPIATHRTWIFGGWTMKQRTVLTATAVLMMASMTGALAAWHYLDVTPHAAFTDSHSRTWDIRTNLPGSVTLFDAAGKPFGTFHTDGGFPRGSDLVLVTYAGKEECRINGYGKHEVRNKAGILLGFAEVAPLTALDKQAQQAANALAEERLRSLYLDAKCFTTNASNSASGGVSSAPGLVAGFRKNRGLSWKMVGYGSVTAEYEGMSAEERQEGRGAALPNIQRMPEAARAVLGRLVTFAPQAGTEPRLFWQQSGNNHTIVAGRWKDLHRSGEFAGYGKHEVKDDTGKIILTLIVTPLSDTPSRR